MMRTDEPSKIAMCWSLSAGTWDHAACKPSFSEPPSGDHYGMTNRQGGISDRQVAEIIEVARVARIRHVNTL